MKAVSPKKKLGQHFLNDLNIAQKIVEILQNHEGKNILEIGPGMGVLTQYLIPKTENLNSDTQNTSPTRWASTGHRSLANINEFHHCKIN